MDSPTGMQMSLPSLDSTLGMLFIGVIVAAILFGITCVQSYEFFRKGANDPRRLKILVGGLLCLDALHLAFFVHALYFYLISNFFNPLALVAVEWSLICTGIVNSLIYTIIIDVYAYRIWILGGQKWFIPIAAALLGLTNFASVLTISIRSLINPSFTELEDKQSISSKISNLSQASAVAADILVAGALVFYMHSASKRATKRTEAVLTVLMKYTINTGLFSAVVQSANFVAFSVNPKNLTYLALYLIHSKLYFNAMLATLNARESLRQKDATVFDDTGTDHIRLQFRHTKPLTETAYDSTYCRHSATSVPAKIDVETELYRHDKDAPTPEASVYDTRPRAM